MLASNATSQLADALSKVSTKEDIYYYNSKSMKKQEIPVIYRSNFIQGLASKDGGQSVVTISPDAGIGSIIMGLQIPARTGATGLGSYTSLGLARGFAYEAIDYVQFR
jgi:hypothetical protein